MASSSSGDASVRTLEESLDMSNEQSLRVRRKLFHALKNIGSVVVVLALLVIGFWGSHYLAPGHPDDSASHASVESESQLPID